MPGVREFFETPAGKGLVGAFVIGAIGLAIYTMLPSRTTSDANVLNTRWFVDAENGKSFKVDMANGTIPMLSPFSNKKTAFPAELCYWTKDGKPKTDPTPVLLNEYKNVDGPTFCPECGRLVVGHNPPPANATSKAPPTKEEYEASGR